MFWTSKHLSYMRDALKVMFPFLLCWPTRLEMDSGNKSIKVGPSHQYSITFWSYVTDGSRGAVWQNGIWCGSEYGAKGETEFLHVEEMVPIDTHWHLLNVDRDRKWMWAQWGRGWCISAVVTVTVVSSTGADFDECGMQALVHCWQKHIANAGDYV